MAAEQQTTPLSKAPRGKYSPQDKKLANDIALAGQMMETALADAEAAPLLSEGGYTPEKLNEILTLQKAAQKDFIARQQADGDQKAASTAFKQADKAARKLFTSLRGFARTAVMRDAAAKTALGLSGTAPKDLQNFIVAAEALADRGADPQYAARLAAKTVTAVKLQALKAKVEDLKAADRAQKAAIEAVPRATAKRDASAKVLFDALVEYKAFARQQFKDRRDIAGRLMI